MKKMYRVKNSREFQSIIHRKKYFANKSFVLYVSLRNQPYSRVGISVGKKLGNAVQRNKIKRQIRMMMQEIHSFEGKFDVICIARPGYLEQSYELNKKELETLLKKVKMYIDAQYVKENQNESI